jgi:hypothetical protein
MFTYKAKEGYEFLLIDTLSNEFAYLSKNTSGLFFFSCGRIRNTKADSVFIFTSDRSLYTWKRNKIKKNSNLYKYREFKFSVIKSQRANTVIYLRNIAK